MKYKLFIFYAILFSLNTIILGNLGNEYLDYNEQEEIQEDEINIRNETGYKNLIFTLKRNDILKSTANISVKVDLTANDLIDISIKSSDDLNKVKLDIIFINGTKKINSEQDESGENKYNFLLKTCDIPHENELYIIISIDGSEESFNKQKRKYYTFNLEYKLRDYGFPNIKDNQEILYDDNSEISYVQNNGILYEGKKIFLTLLGTGMNTFNVEYAFDDSDDYKPLEKNFFNGYGIIIDNNFLTEKNKKVTFRFTLNVDNEEIQVKTRKYSKDDITIEENKFFDIILDINRPETNSQCFKIEDTSKKYTLNYISYTKNIKANYYQSKDEQIINQVSMFKEISGVEQVCFKLDESIQKNIGTLSFQLTAISITEQKIEGNEYRVIRALPTYHYLSKSAYVFIKPKTYPKSTENTLNIRFRMIEGVSQLSTGTLENNEFNSEQKYEDLNSFIFVRGDISFKEDNTYSMVKCIEGDHCKFVIEIKEESEQSYLYQDFRSNGILNQNADANYMIYVKDKKENDLLVNVNYFPYDSIVNILIDGQPLKSANKKENFLLDNKISFIIPQDDMKNDYINIIIQYNSQNPENSKILYDINYQINSNTIPFESGMLYYYRLSENPKFIVAYKNYQDVSIININTFSYDIEIGGKKPENGLIQLINKNEFSLDKNEEDKIINFEAHENSGNSRIFIEIGHLYRNKLTKTTRNGEITYSYIFKKSENRSTNKFVINFRKFSDIPASIIYNDISIETYKLSKLIIIEENDIQCNSFFNKNYQICIFDIKIQINTDKIKEDDSLDFSFQLAKYDKSTSIYLPQNTFMSGLLIPQKEITYYAEITDKNIGKIFVDFLGGEGNAEAEIIKGKESTKITFENKYFDIKNENISQCTEGCYIFVYLDLNNLKNAESSYEYNIYFKTETNLQSSLNVPEGEYMYGYLDSGELDYYRTKIVRKTNNILFFVNCEDCSLKIYNINGNEEKEYHCKTKAQYFINVNDIKEIKYSIENKAENNKKYNIKVVSFFNENSMIIPINSIRNEFCSINQNNPCYFFVSIEDYNSIDNLKFLVHNVDNAVISYVVCTKKNIYDNSIESFIKESEYQKPSNHYLLIEENLDKPIDLIIRVQLDYTENIIFVSFIFELDPTSKNIYQEEFNIIDIYQREEISPFENGLIDYELYLIEGKGYINENKNQKFILEPGIQESINIIDSQDSSSIQLSPYSTETKFILYYRIKIRENNSKNFAELNFQKNNYFKYLNTGDESFWPLNFFMKLNITDSQDNLIDIHFNYKFSNIYNENENQDLSVEYFNISIYLVNQEYIINNQNEDLKPEEKELKLDKIDYINEFTSGYALIEADKILEKNLDLGINYYLLIKIDTNNTNLYTDINLALTLFDLSNNYILPMNEYLLMLINRPTNINIGRDFSNEYTPFIELSSQNLKCSFDDTSINPKEKYGKLFSNLEQDKAYKLILENSSENEIKKPNIITKYSISDKDIYTIFNLTDDKVTEIDDNNQKKIIFTPVQIDPDYLPEISSYIVYNIRIYDRLHDRYYSPNTIFEEKSSMKNMKYFGQGNDEENITYNIDLSNFTYGLYYVSILAEARKGNVYEYLLYKPYNISVVTYDNITIDIEINETKQYTETGYAKNIIFKGNITGEGKYIKLYLTHKVPLEENFIYASQNESFNESTNLYRDSDYKTIDRETALIIPMDKIIKDDPLYIRIPCEDICTYDFHYVVYDDIEINDDQCFDIYLQSDSEAYNFIYKVEKKNINSLFTITGYSLKDFTVTNSKQNANKTYFNGYSYLINNDEYEEFKFEVKGQLRIKICHRSLNQTNNEKDIIDGDKIYTKLNNNEECFNIKNSENISEYGLTFISKTKNIKAKFYKTDNEEYLKEEINEESKNILLDKETNKFCLSKSGKDEEDAGVFFQLISEKGTQESPEMNLLLIKGVSTLQKIRKGNSIYYRINEYSLPNSNNDGNITNNININFQKITGDTEVELAKCTNFPDCDFENINTFGEYFLNNIYYNYDTKSNNDIYHESDFPVVIVKCLDNNETDDCNYYIQMSNNEEVKLLNKNNKVFSFVQDKEETFKINKNPNDKVYLQIRTLTGEVNVHSSDNGKFEYNNNTKFLLFNDSSKDINIKINGTKNSLYNIYYYTEEEDNSFYLSNGEVQYNIISKNEKRTYYFYHKLKKKNTKQYIVSINAINCYLAIKGTYEDKDEDEEGKRYYQKLIENDEALNIKWFYTDKVTINENDKCEFTISSSEIKDKNPKELIINDGIYYYYSLNGINSGNLNSVVLHYLFSKKDDKNMLININKKSDDDLKVTYEFKNNNKNNNGTRAIKKFNDLFYINYQGDSQNNSESNYTNNIEYLIITINSTSSEQIDFRININGRKNMPIYLDPEEIEYGIVQKGEKALYYFDIYNDETENNHQIYLHNKGTAKIEYISIHNKINGEKLSDNIIDNYGIYVNIKSKECENGCRIFFSIYLDGNENNKTNYYNLFNVYRHSNSRKLYVPENTNIYGYFNSNIEKKHCFISKTNYVKLKITLNCQSCVMSLEDEKPGDIKITNTTIIEFSKNKVNKDYFLYEISSEKNEYYYFSFTYISSNKYIDQLEPEKCFLQECLFILPLHNYYMYTQNNIILFIPDNEQVEISSTYYEMNEYENDNLDKIKFPDSNPEETSKNKPIKNRLIVNISSHYNENKYLIIKIKSQYLQGACTLMISQFYNSLNSLNIQYREKIYINDIELKGSSLESNKYKFDLILIDGGGSVSFMLNNEEKYKYYLNYDSRESMSLIMEMGENSTMKAQKASENESFIYYLNITERGDEANEIDKLVLQKANTFKYYHDFKSTKYKILFRPNDLIINFRFLNLIKDEDVDVDEDEEEDKYNYDVENVINEDFKFEIKGNNESNPINIKDYFYSKSLRRGYIYLQNGGIFDYYELTITKNSSNHYTYKNIFLEITPLYIEDEIGKKYNITNIPRNTYLQLEVAQNKDYYFQFYKPNDDYQNMKVELANTSDIQELYVNGENISYFSFDGFGKKNINFSNTQNPNQIKIKFMESGKILLKNTPINNDKLDFILNDYIAYINKSKIKKNDTDNHTHINEENNNESNDSYTFHISHHNLKIGNNNNANISNYKVTYIIRLFDYLDYYDDDEIENILFYNESLSKMSFRKELNESEKNEDIIEYYIYLGELEKNVQYYLSIIGEVSYNDTVEYFSFKSIGDLRIIEQKIFEFDNSWVFVLVSLIIILIILIAYLVRIYIKNKNVVKIELIDDRKQYLLNKANN